MAYHPRESFEDRGGWETETVYFLGTDDRWRSLAMRDLGLADSLHPGVDTYGAGELSPHGSVWAAPTRAGIVLLDLATGQARPVAIPGDHTHYLKWHPGGGRLDIARVHGASQQRTWSLLTTGLQVRKTEYRLPLGGFNPDGSVTVYSERKGKTVRTVHRDDSQESARIPIPLRLVKWGGTEGLHQTLFGVNSNLLITDNSTYRPVVRLELAPDGAAGWPRGWWDRDTVWFAESTRGLLTWDSDDGEVRVLTRVRPPARPNTYWSSSVAVELMR